MAHYSDDKKRKKRVRKRLGEIHTFEMAGVGFGANRRRFAVLKEASMFDQDKLSDAADKLSRIVTVLKSGQPSAQTLEALRGDALGVQATLAGMFNEEGQAFNPADILSKVDALSTSAKELGETSTDLRVNDQVESIQDQVKALTEALQAASFDPQSVTVDEAADEEVEAKLEGEEITEGKDEEVVEAKADEATDEEVEVKVEAEVEAAPAEEVEAKTEETEEVEAAPAEQVETEVEAAPAEETEAATEETEVEAAPEVEAVEETDSAPVETTSEEAPTVEPVKDVVTKSDLAELANALKAGLGEALKEGLKSVRSELETVLKSQNSYSVMPSASVRGDIKTGNDEDENEGSCFGFGYDLNGDDSNLD